MTVTPLRRLRVEEPRPAPQPVPAAAADPPTATDHDLETWRRLAIQTGERLKYAENQLKDLRTAADENRDRMTKAKRRQESGQARINELMTELTTVCAERDALKAQIEAAKDSRVTVERVKLAIWEALADL